MKHSRSGAKIFIAAAINLYLGDAICVSVCGVNLEVYHPFDASSAQLRRSFDEGGVQ